MRALVVKLSALGDILHAMPAVRRAVLHGVRVGWLVDSRYASVLELFPGLEAVHVVGPKEWGRAAGSGRLLKAVGTMRRELAGVRSARYDIAVDIQGLLKSALLARLSATGKVAGFTKNVCREKAASVFYDRRVDVDPLSPVSGQIMSLLAQSLAIPDEVAAPGLMVPQRGRERAGNILGDASPVVLIAGGGWPTKLIPVSVLSQVAQQLADEGPVLVLSGSEGEKERALKITAGLEDGRVLHRENLVNVAGIFERARVVIGPDTGLIHLAAGLDTPTVSVYGPSLGSRSGPEGNQHRWIQSDKDCSPCFQRTCDDIICMEGLDTEAIIGSALEVIRE